MHSRAYMYVARLSLSMEDRELALEDELIMVSKTKNANGNSRQQDWHIREQTSDAQDALTEIKRRIIPYLPPPIVSSIAAIDNHPWVQSHVAPLTYDEPSVATALTILLGFATVKLLRLTCSSTGGRSTLHVDDDEEYDVLKSTGSTTGGGTRNDNGGDSLVGLGPFRDTVALIGGCNAGKTCLFESLCSSEVDDSDPSSAKAGADTVMSMKASAGLVSSGTKKYSEMPGDDGIGGNDRATSISVRLIDYPGHPSLRPKLRTVVEASSRIVLALDSTRPISEGASLLHSILTDTAVASSWRRMVDKVPILVTCTKSSLPKSKNWRRIKIQLRTELERLERVGGATAGTEGPGIYESNRNKKVSLVGSANGRNGGGVDLDGLDEGIPASVHFLSVDVADCNGMDALRNFITAGTVPTTK